MRIHLAGVFVDNQQKALRFYTETLGFQLKHNIPLGDHAWITVVSEEAPEGTELVLEPDDHPAVRPFKRALVEDGIPSTSFAVDDVEAEHERLMARGVRFVQPPTDLGTVIVAV
ncbi:MAG: VOC family protein, partial [Acidobacteria bacterium]|nr:VOC family protein [Acidobacteriota bacterium]